MKISAARYAVGHRNYTPTVVQVLSGCRGESGLEGDVAWNVTPPAQRHIVSNRQRCPHGDSDPVKSSGTRLRVTFQEGFPQAKPSDDGDSQCRRYWESSTARRRAWAMNWVMLNARALAASRTSSRRVRSSQKVTRM